MSIESLLKTIKISCQEYIKSCELIDKSGEFKTGAETINLEKIYGTSDEVMCSDNIIFKDTIELTFNPTNNYKDRLLKCNHIYFKHGSINYRKWFFTGKVFKFLENTDNLKMGFTQGKGKSKDVDEVTDKDFQCVLHNEYEIIYVDKKTDTICSNFSKNVNDIWYLQILDKYNRTILQRRLNGYNDIIYYIDDIERSDYILTKNYELKERLSKLLGNITFQNTYEFFWTLPNVYKITIKKYEESIYLENKEPRSDNDPKNRKVRISESRLLTFIEKYKNIFDEINHKEINHKEINNKDITHKKLCNDVEKETSNTRVMNYNDMSLDYRIQIHKIIQKRHPELFIRKSMKKRYEIQSCKPLLKYYSDI